MKRMGRCGRRQEAGGKHDGETREQHMDEKESGKQVERKEEEQNTQDTNTRKYRNTIETQHQHTQGMGETTKRDRARAIR